ncbi:hypothetical protein GCM10027570_02480 [Streptomonospora sediminis]
MSEWRVGLGNGRGLGAAVLRTETSYRAALRGTPRFPSAPGPANKWDGSGACSVRAVSVKDHRTPPVRSVARRAQGGGAERGGPRPVRTAIGGRPRRFDSPRRSAPIT